MEANNKQPMTATQFIETKGIALFAIVVIIGISLFVTGRIMYSNNN